MSRMGKVEILSPAGNMEKLRVAVAYGADAVYLSGKNFGLRAQSDNFSRNEMKEAVEYAHEFGVRCFLTMNILAHENDFAKLDEEIEFCGSIGVDAIIVSDTGIFRKVRKILPEMTIHISTQASVTNADACLFWYEMGAKRVVLARELTLKEILEIRKKVPRELELECFVHGAMCVSYSGRCLLSDYFTGRSGNRGNCAQPCRWEYFVSENKRPDQMLPVEQDNRGTYIFNSNDLCMIEHIPELIASGIDSFKIEGRIKGSFYTASTTKAYREAIDAYCRDPGEFRVQPEWLVLLERTVHRDFSTGFFFDMPGDNAQIFREKSYCKSAYVVGMVIGYDSNTKRAIIEQRNKIFQGDVLQVLMPEGYAEPIEATDIRNEKGEPIESTPHARMIYSVPTDRELPIYSFVSKDGNKDFSVSSPLC